MDANPSSWSKSNKKSKSRPSLLRLRKSLRNCNLLEKQLLNASTGNAIILLRPNHSPDLNVREGPKSLVKKSTIDLKKTSSSENP